MLSSFYGILVMIALLFLPGFALLSFFKSCWNKTSWVDRLCMMLVLSGCWNYLFFLPRMAAETRFHFYLANSGILIMAALIFSRHSLTRFFKKPWPFVTNFFRAAAIPLFVFALGGFFVGFPFHSLNESRLQPSEGGDVQLFLFKTHLLRAGYSFMDDIYADQINFYPNFLMSEVALATLFTESGLVPNAETFRVILSVTIFWLIYALGRALNLKEGEGIFLALFSLLGYFIWGHLEPYVAAGMGFFTLLLFFYFSCRAFLMRKTLFWIMSGLAFGLVIHSHPVHNLFVIAYSALMLPTYLFSCHRHSVPFRTFLSHLGVFSVGAFFWGTLYYLPVLLRYGFHFTSTFHLREEFNTTLGEFFMSLVVFPLMIPSVIMALLLFFGSWFRGPRFISFFHGFSRLTPSAFFFLFIFSLATLFRIIAIKTHRLAVYIDAGDFYNITLALGGVLLVFTVIEAVKKGFRQSHEFSSAPWILSLLLLLFNINDPTVDEFSRGVSDAIPLYNSAVLMSPEVFASLSSHFERQILLYNDAHSSVFLTPPYQERFADIELIYHRPRESHLQYVIEKYHATHVLWTWQDDPSVLKILYNAPFLKDSVSPNWRGTLFEVI
ncbi:MAG: hypothetical protein UW70_C0037G0038 [Candidatus Peregrinibacteria bacterium GW2011_GWA2_44_7]|nr:MAG: hypothetical protein UW70_C0037G0038 [Candidatus Peregrinibacteria bacterium GW2011_GWA2_44_7]